LREMGNVILPHSSSVFTTSLVTSRQERQTAAHATTCLRAGHVASPASTLCITFSSSSGGRLAHRPCCCGGPSWTWPCRCACCWPAQKPGQECRDPAQPWPARLDMLPMPSLISLSSRTMLFRDIAAYYGELPSSTQKETSTAPRRDPPLLHESSPKNGRDGS
jgi:hypothetical protein